MRLLVFTTLFPRPKAPHHGIFVWERLRHYLARHGGEAVVIAPVPWIPAPLARGNYAEYADVPLQDWCEGVRVLRPRYFLAPKVGMSTAPFTLARAGLRAVAQLAREGQHFDLVDAHYLYPDAVAARRVAAHLGLPLVATARGSDVSLLPRYRLPRFWLRSALRRTDAVICVCQALADALEPLRPASLPVRVLGNGVDAEKFRPLPRPQARRELGWTVDVPTIVSVGHLIERKGHHHLIDAMPQLPGVVLEILGAGPLESRLRRQIESLGLGDRVRLRGTLPHDQLHRAYSAADLSVLLSSREGWPNVVMESLACGTPVVATKIWGTPEILCREGLGQLLHDVRPATVAEAIRSVLDRALPREPIRQYAEGLGWDKVADGMHEVFQSVLARKGERPG